jgi:hypothetical protein
MGFAIAVVRNPARITRLKARMLILLILSSL